MKYPIFLIVAISSMFFYSCTEEEVIAPTENYLRILDTRYYNAEFDPVSLQMTPTGGSLILTATDHDDSPFSAGMILRADSLGQIISSEETPANIAAPVGNLINIGEWYYFAGMDVLSLGAVIIPVTANGELGTPVPVGNGLRYPLALSETSDGNLLLLSYDPDQGETDISIVGTDGVVKRSAGYSIGPANDVEPLIFSHFTNPDARLTFFAGETSDGVYYFNGFYNFTLSLVFTNFGDEPSGVVQGQQTFTGIRSILPLGDGTFTVMGYQYDRNFLRPQVSLPTNTITSSVDLFVSALPEVLPNAFSKSIFIDQPDGRRLVVTATETQNRQTILYFHDLSGNLLGIKRFGSLNPFTISDLISTEDGGLMMTGTTFLASRFERIYIARVPASQVMEIVGN